MKLETKCGTLYKNNVGTIVQKQVVYKFEALHDNFVSYKVSQGSERIKVCSSMAGNASPFRFASRVRLVLVDANPQNVECLRQHALVGLFIQQIRPFHVDDTAVAEACTMMAWCQQQIKTVMLCAATFTE